MSPQQWSRPYFGVQHLGRLGDDEGAPGACRVCRF
jgi:hypothetical protein